MIYRRNKDAFTNSTQTNEYFIARKEAYSYGWWKYFAIINNKAVFNGFSYSNTTSKHQSDTLQLFRDKNIHIDLYVECPRGLQNLESGITHYLSKIKALRLAIQAPRSRKATNIMRARDINTLQLRIIELKELMKPACD